LKKLDWFILKSYVGPLLFTFFIALFILVMQFLWKYVDELVGKGLEVHVLLELLFYASSTFVPLALPLAILLSSLMTFGNFGEHYELVAMKSTGIPLRRIMKPLIILSIFISAFAFLFSNNVLPFANLKFHSLLYDVRQKKLTFNIQEGVFYNGIDGYTIYVREKDPEKNIIRDVMIYDHTDRMGNVKLTTAEWGKMELSADQTMLVFHLFDGYNYEEVIDRSNYRINRPFQRSAFEEQKSMFSGLDFGMSRTDESLFRNNFQMMNLEQLENSGDSLRNELKLKKRQVLRSIDERFVHFNQLDSLNNIHTDPEPGVFASVDTAALVKAIDFALQSTRSIKNNLEFNNRDLAGRERRIVRHDLEWHRKFTLSIACLILFFIGAPLGAIIRKGGLGMPVVFSIIFFVIFHVISISGEKYARAGVLEPGLAMWLASIVLFPVGFFLTYKATTDSPLLDADTWNKLFKRFLPPQKEKDV
jgi:lipopolysaccharide export system permease protein